MFASGLDCVDYQLEQVIDDKYIRIQSQLKVASTEMDNITIRVKLRKSVSKIDRVKEKNKV